MNQLIQFAQAVLVGFFGGIRIVFETIFGALQIKNAVDGVKEQMLASVFGVPVWVISLISFLMLVGGIAFALIKRQCSRN